MFCYQCQETVRNEGCAVRGVCGKTEETSNLQDLLIYLLSGMAITADKAKEKGPLNPKYGRFIMEALFATITNANFDDAALLAKVDNGIAIKKQLLEEAAKNGVKLP